MKDDPLSNPISTAEYVEKIQRWRASLDDALRAENSWLALAGLIWLEEKVTAFGSEDRLALQLRVPGLASVAGGFHLDDKGVELFVYADNNVLVNGEQVDRVRLRADTFGDPHKVTVGPYTMMLIERGGRLGIRLWDNARQQRRSFPGRRWFPIAPHYRLNVRFLPSSPPRMIAIPNEMGDQEESPSPGMLEFELEGYSHRLEALEGPEGSLFLLVKDRSSEDESCGSGRFLVTPPPQNGRVELDFNRAYNPPCAFTPYATCPRPPEQNMLPVFIHAGEKKPGYPIDEVELS
jgi:uncharacterized protein (DUF1684 family)